MIVYGPVPSRRLGRSLGINNIPPKSCTYACTYCQVGRTRDMKVERREFHEPARVVGRVRERLAELDRAGEKVDYLSLVPDGEPTLDIHLRREIVALRGLGLPIAVISNGTLLTHPEVRDNLAAADWVSVKVDATDVPTWHRLNRPHSSLDLTAILEGLLAFRDEFKGHLATETMLVAGVNDSADHAVAIARFLARLNPQEAYVSLPTRPPACRDVKPASGAAVRRYRVIFAGFGIQTEGLVEYEGNRFTAAGDPALNLLSVTAVHPMRREAVADLLVRSGATWSLVEELVAEGRLQVTEHEGHTYYVGQPGQILPIISGNE